MSDLALPFLMLFEDDTLAFWCFERLMRRVSVALWRPCLPACLSLYVCRCPSLLVIPVIL